ncbi:holin family protein [Halomonas denitrificans]|uniref:3TM-type holin n=1 Tax=Halomonas denitrificans TaxID=370769 RepID=UPI001CD63A3D|nr:3TM-type holin [Halomonas denitrificans]MCA0973421.1 holin family protein [Halomonas denitrificans]
MNWRDAVEEVAKYAPAVATALGGPAVGGAAAGASLMVTSALGIENDPAALVAATQDPAKRAELVRLNNEHRQALEAIRLEAEKAAAAEQTARLTETQRTMRAELEHEGWFKSGWRPALGWVFAFSLGTLSAVMAYTIAIDPTVVGDPEFTGMLIWLFVTMGAALGINVRQRTVDKALERGQQPRTFMDAIKTR